MATKDTAYSTNKGIYSDLLYRVKENGIKQEISAADIDNIGIDRFAEEHPNATIEMHDSRGKEYSVPINRAKEMRSEGWQYSMSFIKPTDEQKAAYKAQAEVGKENLKEAGKQIKLHDDYLANGGKEGRPVVGGWTTDKGKPMQEFIRPDGSRTTNPTANELYNKGFVNSQLDELYKEQKEINKRMLQRQREIDNKSTFVDLLQNADRANFAIGPYSRYMQDEQFMQLQAADRQNRRAIKLLEDSKSGKTNQFWKEFMDKISDGYTLSRGVSEITDLISALDSQKYIDAINKKRANGEELTDEERTAELFLSALSRRQATEGEFADQYGAMARAGAMGAQSLDFMTDMLINPYGASVAKGVTKGIGKVGARALAKDAADAVLKRGLKATGRGLVKATGIVVGAHTGGAVIANTTGAGRTIGGVSTAQMPIITRNEKGYKVTDSAESITKSVLNAEREMAAEYGSEMFGAAIAGKAGKAINAGLKNIGLSKVSNTLTSIANKNWYKNYNKLLGAGGYNGIPGEALEEYEGMMFEMLTGGGKETWEQLTDTQTNIDIWLGVATMGAIMGAVPTIGTGAHMAQYYRYKHNVNIADAQASQSFGIDRWQEIRDRIDTADNATIAGVVVNELQTAQNDEQKKAILDYTRNLQKMRGYNIADISNAHDKKDEDIETANNSYATGYNATDPTDLQDIHNIYLLSMEKIPVEVEALIDRGPVGAIATLKERGQLTEDILNYINARQAYIGMMQRIEDDINEAIEQNNAIVDKRTNRDTGLLQEATLKVQNDDGTERRVHIIKGNIALRDDGTIDKDRSDRNIAILDVRTGEEEIVSPDAIFSVESPVDPTQEKAIAADAVRQSYTAQAEAKINGIVSFQPGDKYNILTPEGESAQIQIVPNANGMTDNGDGTVNVTSDNGQTVVVMSKDEIQGMVNAANIARVADRMQPQRQQEQVISQEEQQQGTIPDYYPESRIAFRDENGNIVQGVVNTIVPEDNYVLVDIDTPSGLRVVPYKIGLINNNLESITDEEGNIIYTKPQEETSAPAQNITLTEQQIDILLAQMKEQAEIAQNVELNPITWNRYFGENGIINTPLGEVKMGENQIAKFFSKGRDKEFGMVAPTLSNPDIVIEKDAPAENAERNTKLLFVKTFIKSDGSRYVHFESVTVKKDGMEVSISSHEANEKTIKKEMQNGNILHLRIGLPFSSEGYLTETPLQEGPDLVPTSDNTSPSDNKDNTNLSQIQEESALSRIPIDENGQPIYEQTDPETAWDAIVEQTGGNEDIAVSVVNSMISDKEFQLKKVEKSKPKGGTTIAEKIAAEQERNNAIQQAQAELKHWRDIANVPADRQRAAQAEARRLQDEQARENAARIEQERRAKEEAERIERETLNGVPDMIDDTPADARARGYRRVSGNRVDRTTDSTGGTESGGRESIANNSVENSNLNTAFVNENANSNETNAAETGLDNGRTVEGRTKRSPLGESETWGRIARTAEAADAGGIDRTIRTAEKQVNTNPTEPQKEAGNYKKGHVKVGSFDITIEQPKGSIRSGVDANGNKWESEMQNTYGYIRGTKGVDGDHIDVFLADNIDGWNGTQVFVIDQYNEDGTFDEHKVMLGFNNQTDAFNAYLSNYEKGWENTRKLVITSSALDNFKEWIDSSNRKTKPYSEYKNVIDKERKKYLAELQDFHDRTASTGRTSTDETKFEHDNLYLPLKIDGKESPLAVMIVVPDRITDPSEAMASYLFSPYPDSWDYWESMTNNFNAGKDERSRAFIYGDTGLILFDTVDNAVEFYDFVNNSRQQNDIIQGLETYSRDEIKSLTRAYIENAMSEAGITAEIAGMEIHGSRNRGDANIDSDLDIVVEYKGDVREDDMFNALNDTDNPFTIEEIAIDINPIRAEESGTLEDYMARSREYDKSKTYAANTNIQPIGHSKFGYIYDQFKGKAQEAFRFLQEKKSGYLKGVFHRNDIGDIDLVWGNAPTQNSGKGLAHILRKHVETQHDFSSAEDAANTISDVIENGVVTDGANGDTYNIEKGNYRVVIARDAVGNWVLTAFDFKTSKKDKKKGTPASVTPGETASADGAGAVAPNLSKSKDSDNKIKSEKEYIEDRLNEAFYDREDKTMSRDEWEDSDEYIDVFNRSSDSYPAYIRNLHDTGVLQEFYDKGSIGEKIKIRKAIDDAGFQLNDMLDLSQEKAENKHKREKKRRSRMQDTMQKIGILNIDTDNQGNPIDGRNLERIKRQAEREDGELLILTPEKGAAASLSTLPSDSSSAAKDSNKNPDIQKIEDYGEQIAGARKDILKDLAKNVENTTLQSLISLSFAKAFKRPDLKKAFDEGALREKDVRFAEAVMAATLSRRKPKAGTRKDRYSKWDTGKTQVELWAENAYSGIELLKSLFMSNEAERDALIERTTANKTYDEDKAKGRQRQLEEWNPGRIFNGTSYPINPVAVFSEVLERLGYEPGSNINIPITGIVPDSSYDRYDLIDSNGNKNYYETPKTFEEVVNSIVYLTKLDNADADTVHPRKFFSFAGREPVYNVTGWVVYEFNNPRSASYKDHTFQTKEDAQRFIEERNKNHSKGYLYLSEPREIREVSKYNKYEAVFINPLTGNRVDTGIEYNSKEEAENSFEKDHDRLDNAVNQKLSDEQSQKKGKTSGKDILEILYYKGENGWKYGVAIADPNARKYPGYYPVFFAEDLSTRKEAEELLKNNREKWETQAKEIREKRQKFVYFDGESQSRAGEDYRNGKNITAEEFANTFGFRGVQFGNWTNQNDRQAALNNAFDAFMDLSRVLNVSPRALSLNGELGIAFGSRGTGNANAHYEPGNIVINLTKTRGAGSLAHEWWHALDNYFSRKGDIPHGYVTANKNVNMRSELRDAFNKIIDNVAKSDFHNRSRKVSSYFGNPIEETARLFGEWVVDEMAQKNSYNHFLSRGIGDAEERYAELNYAFHQMLNEAMGKKSLSFEEFKKTPQAIAGFVYPTRTELAELGKDVRNLFDTVQEKIDEETGNTILYHKSSDITVPSAEEIALRDAVIDKLRESGLEVITDVEVGQRVLDEANRQGERVRTQAALNGLKKASDFILSALSEKTKQRKVRIEIPERANRLAEEAIGHPIKSHAININELTHIKKRHGENGTANDTNSIPLRDKDIALMPYIMAAPTRVVKGNMAANGTESVRYEKDLENGVVVVVEREGRFDVEDMENITMWANKKPATNVTVATKTSHSTSETIVISEADAAKIRKDAETAIENDGKIRLNAKQKRALETASVSLNETSSTAISSADGAKIVKSLDELAQKYENDLKITDHVRFFKTSNGDSYGFTIGNKIYIDPSIASAETPIHEYTHLWASALRKNNPQEWQNIVGLMKNTPVWEEVTNKYPELQSDDEIADEVLATYSGHRGAQRLRDEIKNAAQSKQPVTEKAEVVGAFARIREALRRFWKNVADLFNIHFTNAEEVADRVLSDMLNGVNPVINNIDKINTRFNEQLEQQANGTLPKGHIYQLGLPGEILRSTGIPALPIELSSTRLAEKAAQRNHEFDITDVKELPKAMQNPIAVFSYGNKNKAQNIIVEIERNGKSFVVGLHLNQNRRGLDINDIRGIFPKNNAEWLNWITHGKMLYIDKTKIQDLIDKQRTNLAEVEYLDLDSIANIVKNFENPNIESADENFSRIRYQKSNDNSLMRDDDTMFRETDNVAESAREIYERQVKDTGDMNLVIAALNAITGKDARKRFKNKFAESHFDFSRSIKALQDAIAQGTGRRIQDFEDVWKTLNAKSPVDMIEIKRMMFRYVEPLSLHIGHMIAGRSIDGHKMTMDDVEIYLNAKHGIERNIRMAEREAFIESEERGISYDESFKEKRKKDYAGLTELFGSKTQNGSIEELEEAARQYCEEFESKVGMNNTNEMWRYIHELNGFTLRKSYLSGQISKKMYDETMQMYEYYVPLRGWKKNYAGDIYQYISRGAGDTPLQNIVRKAYGRTSAASDILGTMAAMANTAIVTGNKNIVAQKLFNLAQNHSDSGLFMVGNQWYEKSESGEYKPVFPDLREDMTAEEMAEEITKHEQRMKELSEQKDENGEPLARIINRSFNKSFPMKLAKWQAQQHSVNVMRNGKEYTVYILGNPRAAMALNGLLNRKAESGEIAKGIEQWMRFKAKMQTSLSPEFLISNFQRDVLTAITSEYIKYGGKRAKQFAKNLQSIMPLAPNNEVGLTGIYGLFHKYNKGTLDMNNPTEKMFSEFVNNGGITGISQMYSSKEYEKKIGTLIARARRGKIDAPAQAIRGLADAVDFINMGVENITRFAAYMTARQNGATVTDSVSDAKNVSVNFNMHGSGAWLNLWMRKYILYANPALQSLRMLGTWYDASPKRFMGVMSAFVATSFTLASLLFLAGGDDDDNKYYKLSEWNRYNYINIPAPGGYFHYSIPQELRPVWALGQIAFDLSTERITPERALNSMMMQLNNLTPVAFFAAGADTDDSWISTGIRAFTPTIIADFADAYVWNENFLGMPIHNQKEWNRYAPEWKRVTEDTPQWAVDMSRAFNNLTGGSDNRSSWWDSEYLNPGSVNYIINQQIGGLGTIINKLSKLGEQWSNPEEDIELRNIPFVSKFYVSVGDDYSKNRVLNDKFYMIWNEFNLADYEFRNNIKDLREGNMSKERFDKLMQDMEDDGSFALWSFVKSNKLDKTYSKLMDVVRDNGENADQASEKLLELKRSLVDWNKDRGKKEHKN